LLFLMLLLFYFFLGIFNFSQRTVNK